MADFRYSPTFPTISSSSKMIVDLFSIRYRNASAFLVTIGSECRSCLLKYSVINKARSTQRWMGLLSSFFLILWNGFDLFMAGPGDGIWFPVVTFPLPQVLAIHKEKSIKTDLENKQGDTKSVFQDIGLVSLYFRHNKKREQIEIICPL